MTELRKLLEPGLIKNVRIKNRVSMAPMERCYADMDGAVTQKYIDYMVERAKNGVGMMAVESTYVDPAGRGRVYQLGLHDDKLVPSHRRLTEAVHKYGTKIAAEIQHAGRQTISTVAGFHVVGPSPVPCEPTGGEIPRELTVVEIERLVQKFAEASRRAKDAGYDVVTIHGAHGYLINAFASPFCNKRNDQYGGSMEKRMRFPLEVYHAVRAVVGESYPVGFRMSADEFVDGGLTLDDGRMMAKTLEEAGVDYLDVSCAIYESTPMICAPMDMPLGYLTHLSAAIKEVVEIPIIATGRINDMILAERVLENNHADYVHMVRAFHADPEILVKSQKGAMDDICMCMACNKCVDVLLKNLPIICTVNPCAGREREFKLKPAKARKRIMVIGGGVAGMEAARIARIRGHEVTLFEKDADLGGQIRWASKGKYHEEFFQTARFRIHEVKRTGVKLELGKEVTLADVTRFNPEVVVIATGAIPFVPMIPGVDSASVSTTTDILSGKRAIGRKSLVVGGGREGLTVAEFLIENGSQVSIVEASDALGSDLGPVRQWVSRDRIKEHPAMDVMLKTTVEGIGDKEVELCREGKFEKLAGVDSVVLAWARKSVSRLADEIAEDSKVHEIYRIGDAVIPRDASDAIYEGALIGRMI
jgi:2,4-dienoyl-CoA reductase-like NADH-dependent reductase (Old Yellow Enzyme family)/thioredoxin reductase